MKNIFIKNITPVLSVVLILALSSCTKEQSESAATGVTSQKIRITGSDANANTKTTLNGLVTSWSTGDEVGIYSPTARPTSGEADGVTNRRFSAVTAGYSSAFTAISGNEMYWGAANPHMFYAYYPYSAAAFVDLPDYLEFDERYVAPGTFWPKVKFTLPKDQVQSSANNNSHIGALDAMIATPVSIVPGTTGEQSVVNFSYNHVFSILEFQIKGTGSLQKISVSSAGVLAVANRIIDISQTTPAAGVPYTVFEEGTASSEASVTLTTPAALDGTTATSVYMMITPGSPSGEIYIGLLIDGEWKYIRRNAAPGTGFARSKKYIVALNSSDATVVAPYYDVLGTPTPGVLIAGRFWAPVNAGYSETERYGLMYQWGRKYGQKYNYYPIRFTTETDPIVSNSMVSRSEGNLPANSNTYYYILGYPYDWSNEDASSWDMTSYNPCPSGWRVPTIAELTALKDAGSTSTTSGMDGLKGIWVGGNHSTDHAGSIFLPKGGSRIQNYGYSDYRTYNGFYWSSDVHTTIEDKISMSFYFSISGSISITSSTRSDGLSVRCVKEFYVK